MRFLPMGVADMATVAMIISVHIPGQGTSMGGMRAALR